MIIINQTNFFWLHIQPHTPTKQLKRQQRQNQFANLIQVNCALLRPVVILLELGLYSCLNLTELQCWPSVFEATASPLALSHGTSEALQNYCWHTSCNELKMWMPQARIYRSPRGRFTRTVQSQRSLKPFYSVVNLPWAQSEAECGNIRNRFNVLFFLWMWFTDESSKKLA